jgi:hypothetical protein
MISAMLQNPLSFYNAGNLSGQGIKNVEIGRLIRKGLTLTLLGFKIDQPRRLEMPVNRMTAIYSQESKNR